MNNGFTTKLIDAATATVTGRIVAFPNIPRIIHAEVNGTGAVTATIEIYGTTYGNTVNAVLLATITLSGTNAADDGFAMSAPWPEMYAVVTAISGTNAAVDVIASC